MPFLMKIRAALMRLMAGRNGSDSLGLFTLFTGLIIDLIDSFLRTGVLSVLGLALYVLTLYRMFSRNLSKRSEENRRYLVWQGKVKKFILRYYTRFKNCRQYKYFSCPQCKASIRMKRGMGEKEITCPGCKHVFKQKS